MDLASASVPYLIQRPNSNAVEVWSLSRLPFEPKGWLAEMRNLMKTEILNLPSSENSGFYTRYTSPINENFDVENVLLYNVGVGAFAYLCQKSLCFEMKIGDVPANPLQQAMSHYSYYSVVNGLNDLRCWKKLSCLAQWSNISFSSLRGEKKPHSFWYAIKTGNVSVFNSNSSPKFFGLELHIKAPQGQKLNLASAIKPILDGFISAFHVQDGLPDPVVTARLAALLGENPQKVGELLCDSRLAILGKRKLVHPYQKGIQWNPADDLCMGVKVTQEDTLIGSEWLVDGELFSVVPVQD